MNQTTWRRLKERIKQALRPAAVAAAIVVMGLAGSTLPAYADVPLGQVVGTINGNGQTVGPVQCNDGQSSAVVDLEGNLSGSVSIFTAAPNGSQFVSGTFGPPLFTSANVITASPGKSYVSLASDGFVEATSTAFTSGSDTVTITCSSASAPGGSDAGYPASAGVIASTITGVGNNPTPSTPVLCNNTLAFSGLTTSTQEITLAAGKNIYICSWLINFGGTTPGTASLTAGTGVTCTTSPTTLTGAFTQGVNTSQFMQFTGAIQAPAGNNVCLTFAGGSAPTYSGFLQWTRF